MEELGSGKNEHQNNLHPGTHGINQGAPRRHTSHHKKHEYRSNCKTRRLNPRSSGGPPSKQKHYNPAFLKQARQRRTDLGCSAGWTGEEVAQELALGTEKNIGKKNQGEEAEKCTILPGKEYATLQENCEVGLKRTPADLFTVGGYSKGGADAGGKSQTAFALQ